MDGEVMEILKKERCELLAKYVIETGATVRNAASYFGVSKSTVHKDVTQELPQCDPALAERVREVLDLNKSERHLRGGEATRRKYKKEEKKPPADQTEAL